jgi:hypothetical protein
MCLYIYILYVKTCVYMCENLKKRNSSALSCWQKTIIGVSLHTGTVQKNAWGTRANGNANGWGTQTQAMQGQFWDAKATDPLKALPDSCWIQRALQHALTKQTLSAQTSVHAATTKNLTLETIQNACMSMLNLTHLTCEPFHTWGGTDSKHYWWETFPQAVLIKITRAGCTAWKAEPEKMHTAELVVYVNIIIITQLKTLRLKIWVAPTPSHPTPSHPTQPANPTPPPHPSPPPSQLPWCFFMRVSV